MSDTNRKSVSPDKLIDATIAALQELKTLGATDLEVVVEVFPGLAMPAVGTGFGLRKSDRTKGMMKIFLSPEPLITETLKNPNARITLAEGGGEDGGD